ncbi:MAG: enoyl-CoA hydratase/isomerase family protein [Alphaproteobacteria bacterium]|jgi:methylglutaconyl-CoA hydratase|nr:enoyl-CoA hydratase/isomerase family protein [Alphaproteobacteria bacterium]MDP6818523.1 enoyl-CoA hydratase/isomerase family protein [Alphaproteobacteria bacterium]
MAEGHVLVTVDTKGVATVTLNRPEMHNAINGEAIERLTRELRTLGEDEDVRIVLLTARGPSFCAGADLNWMKKTAEFSEAENLQDASALAELLLVLDTLPKPTIALIQGPAYAGGVGLICACDIAIAARSARFSITEVRLGLIPAVISPFVINAIGESYARRYFLTGERISSADAERIGLVHEVVPDEALAVRGETFVNMLMKGGPKALTEAKGLIAAVHGRPLDNNMLVDLARRIARIRVSDEGQEGMSAFEEKRKPSWQ